MLWNKRLFTSDSEENRLALKISFIAFIGVLLCIWFLIFLNGLYLKESEKDTFISDIEFFRTNLAQDTSFYDMYMRDDFLSRFKKKELIHRLTRDIMIIRESGQIYRKGIFEIIDVNRKDMPTNQHILERVMGERDFLLYEASFGGDTVVFSRDITFIREFQKTLTIVALLLSLVFFLVILVISLKIASYTLRPIRQTNERLKEYNHHVAHELKTPLAVVKSNLELAQISGDTEDIKASQLEIDGLEKIINALLFLSENTLIRDGKKIHLNEICKKIIQSFDTDKRFHLHESNKDIFVQKNEILLEQLFKNLIENALKYSTGDTFFIELHKNYFSVSNSIETQIPIEKLSKLFEPFYKIDTSRSTPGYGLGLSIVKRIVEIFGWKVSLESKKKLFTIKITF